MRRGAIVTVALQGDFGKARPALVVQSDLFSEHPSVSLALISSEIVQAPLMRVIVEPSDSNGLRIRSQIAIDKLFTVRREKLENVVGQIDEGTMLAINRAMMVFLGLA